MEVHLLALQARILAWIGCGWIGLGLFLGQDPFTVAWRAALGAMIAAWLGGKLLHLVTGVVEERMAADLADRELAAVQAVEATATKSKTSTKPKTAGRR